MLCCLRQNWAAKAEFECGPTGVRCIKVDKALDQVVSSRNLGMQCEDNQGNPDHERITLNVSGHPTTSGATATFVPEVIRAYEAGSILTIDTFETTKAGQYVVKVGGTGEHCGVYPGFQIFLWVVPDIYRLGANDIWWFDDANPEGYPDRITLVALPPNRPPYEWFIHEGSKNYLSFRNGGNFIRTNTNKVVVIGNQPTVPGSPAFVDVTSDGSPASQLEKIFVLKPHILLDKGFKHFADADTGYATRRSFVLRDQYGDRIPGPTLPINVVFRSQHEIHQNNNWILPPAPHFKADPDDFVLLNWPATAGGKPVQVEADPSRRPLNRALRRSTAGRHTSMSAARPQELALRSIR